MKNIINNLKLTYLIGYNWLQNIDNMIFLISILLLSTPLLNIGKYRFEIIIITLLLWLIGLIICSLIWVLLRKCDISCKHDYNLINQFEMSSDFDIIVQNGKIPNTHNSRKRKTVTDYKCTKCNKIKRLETVTPK